MLHAKLTEALAKDAVYAIEKCVKNGVVPIIQFTQHGQIINFVSLDDDLGENFIPVLAELQYEILPGGQVESQIDLSTKIVQNDYYDRTPDQLN